MKLNLLLAVLLGSTLIACSSQEDPPNTDVAPPVNSEKKENYVKTCSEEMDKDLCGCQFDAMDPILSKSIGENWSTDGMKEEDFEKFVSAVEVAVDKCT